MNILSFDIEEWYVYQNMGYSSENQYIPRLDGLLSRLLDRLDETHTKATFFCLGIIARQHPYLLRRIVERGHEIACHSDKHEWLTQFTYAELRADTRLAVDSIEDAIGQKIKGYRAPAFSITPQNKWALEILVTNGIEYDCSIFPASRDFGGFKGLSLYKPATLEYEGCVIKEFPMSITRIMGRDIAFSGGGYFRLIPYAKIKSIVSKLEYMMSYFHMRDFDIEQKRNITLRYFKNYYGVNGAYEKFLRFTSDFDFCNVADANLSLDWTNVPHIKL